MDERDALLDSLAGLIADERVLVAMAAVPRDAFVPARLRRKAWEDEALPLSEGQTISQPRVVARMTELLALEGDERVLDVGTGSGYHAAVLARLARDVVTIERRARLAVGAREALAHLPNVEVVLGDGSRGHPERAPYDAINVAAGCRQVPTSLVEQLAEGGRLVAPVSDRLIRITRRGEDLRTEQFEGVRFVPLISG